MNKLLVWSSVLIGIVFLALAALYWTTPAGSLPSYMPGFQAGVAATHFKHGLGCLLVGLALFTFAWFKSAPKKPSAV